MFNKRVFFDNIRGPLFDGRLTASQTEGLEKTIDYWLLRFPQVTVPQMAYILATIHHETGRAMIPVREAGGERYLRSKRYYPWVGEGLVQVTWEVNARKFGAKKPGDLMSWPIALYAAFYGMTEGVFTGKKLSDYINARRMDFLNARRIINGVDRAQRIANYANLYLAALRAATK